MGESSQLNVRRVIRTPYTTWKGREQRMVRIVELMREGRKREGLRERDRVLLGVSQYMKVLRNQVIG